jgi:ComF family protein
MGPVLRGLAEDLQSALFPSPCVACLRFPDPPLVGGVCLECWSRIDYRVGPSCPGCGRIHPGPEDDVLDGLLCGACRVRHPPFEAGISMAWYRDPTRAILRSLKFGRRPELARPLARRAHAFLGARPSGPPAADLVVPVPLPTLRRLRRGYNQSEEVARHLARRLGIPMAGRLLSRRLQGRPQAGLRAAERERNVHGAFRIRRPGRLRGRRVLLVDDVWTTGATLRACARALLQGGAEGIVAFSLARVPDDFDEAAGPTL